MKVMLVAPSAEFSTFDCFTGIRSGFEAVGQPFAQYLLYQRIKMAQIGAAGLAHALGIEDQPDMETCLLHAAEGLPYRVVAEGCDWLLAVAGMGLHPNALAVCRAIGVKVAVWFTEAPYETTEEKELGLARLCDVAFVNERTAVADFQRALDAAGNGGAAYYLPHAHNPAVHCPGEPDPDLACDVVLVGTGFAERQALLEAVDWTGIDLKIAGLWTGIKEPSILARHHVYPCLDNRETVKLYRSAKIVLNPHRWHPTAESANPRVYEAAAVGACQVSDHRAEVAELFGEAVPTYPPGVPWRLEALVRELLVNDATREAYSATARHLARSHTFEARARTVVSTLGSHGGRRLSIGVT